MVQKSDVVQRVKSYAMTKTLEIWSNKEACSQYLLLQLC